MRLERSRVARPPRGQGRVIAVFSYRYDAHLVPDLLANIEPAVHGWVALDDRDAGAALSDEPARRGTLIAAAREAGADWILAVDPDERFESALAARIGWMTARRQPPTLWSFRVCELFAEDAFRVDGIWGRKRQVRLFPAELAKAPESALHGQWVDDTRSHPRRDSGVRLYHLRMASPRRRQHRRDTYASADPERRCQAIGYDQLVDTAGLRLERIEHGRAFHPPFVEDHGLWAVELPRREPPPDPPVARLRYVQASRMRAGAASAADAMADLVERAPGGSADPDLLALSAQLALEAGDSAEVERITGSVLEARGGDPRKKLCFRMLRGRARLWAGDEAGAAADLAALQRDIPESRYARHLLRQAAPFDPAAPDAPWRRWADAGAELLEGAGVANSPLAVVIIGYRAPSDLRGAVRSVLEQEVSAEIVVVNSGGGPVREVLAPFLDRIRLIACKERRFVGAARNIGIDASRAPYLAFLASDCRAMPGWTAGRLARHRAGAVAVASPVVPDRHDSLVSRAVNLAMHHRRQPETEADGAALFGASYARRVFTEFGYFSTACRISEDAIFNARLAKRHRIDWAPEVVTTHRYPTSLRHLALDQFRRGRHRAVHPPYRALAGKPGGARQTRDVARHQQRAAIAAMQRQASEAGVRRLALAGLIVLASVCAMLGTLVGLRRIAAAARHSERALALADSDPERAERARRAAVALLDQDAGLHLTLAQSLRRAAPERAAGHLRLAAELAPHQTRPTTDLAELHVALGRPEEALRVLDEAICQAPDVPWLWRRAAGLAARLERPAEALLYARGAFVLIPTHAIAHEQLMRVHRRLGSGRAAQLREWWMEALKGQAPRVPPFVQRERSLQDGSGQAVVLARPPAPDAAIASVGPGAERL